MRLLFILLFTILGISTWIYKAGLHQFHISDRLELVGEHEVILSDYEGYLAQRVIENTVLGVGVWAYSSTYVLIDKHNPEIVVSLDQQRVELMQSVGMIPAELSSTPQLSAQAFFRGYAFWFILVLASTAWTLLSDYIARVQARRLRACFAR